MLRELLPTLLPAGSAIRAHDLSRLNHLFEPAEVVVEVLAWIFPEVAGYRLGRGPAGHVVPDLDVHLGPLIPGGAGEIDASGIVDVGPLGRPPGDALARDFLDNLRIPIDRLSEGGRRAPVALGSSQVANLFEMSHEAREVLEPAPELVKLLASLAHGDRRFDLHERLFSGGGGGGCGRQAAAAF